MQEFCRRCIFEAYIEDISYLVAHLFDGFLVEATVSKVIRRHSSQIGHGPEFGVEKECVKMYLSRRRRSLLSTRPGQQVAC